MTARSLEELEEALQRGVQTGDLRGARSVAREILNIKPSAIAHALAGSIDNAEGDIAGGVYHLEKAVALDPMYLGARRALAQLYQVLGQRELAVAQYEWVLAADRTSIDATVDLAYCLLLFGRLEQGFAAYEARLPRLLPKYGLAGVRTWDGTPAPAVLIQGEGGYGDMIHFARFLPQVCERVKRVLLRIPPALEGLFREHLDRRVHLVVTGKPEAEPLPAGVDRAALMMSLPHLLGTTLGTIPPAPFLGPRFPVVDNRERLKVGLIWAGSPLHPRDKLRSMTAPALQRLMLCDRVDWHVLQMGPPHQMIATYGHRPHVQDRADEIRTWADTARVMAGLDAVVTIDSAPVHLAAALGVPTLLLLPQAPEWRWPPGERPVSPWYPAVEIFRCPRANAWEPAIDGALARLAELQGART